MPKPTRARLRLRFLLGPITSSIMRQRRRGELDTTNPRTYARLLRTAIEADRTLRDGAIPAYDRHHRRRADG
jgi:hypothetical protein